MIRILFYDKYVPLLQFLFSIDVVKYLYPCYLETVTDTQHPQFVECYVKDVGLIWSKITNVLL